MTQRDPKTPKKKPDLTLVPISDDELDELAKITDEDILGANEKWREKSRAEDKDLLQAEDGEETTEEE